MGRSVATAKNDADAAGMRFGIFLAPFHRTNENPTLAIQRDIELMEFLDRLGFDEAWIGERHSGGLEIIALPEVFIAAAAERTKRIKFGTGVASLPYHHPLALADHMIQLDHQTRGRTLSITETRVGATMKTKIELPPTQRPRIAQSFDYTPYREAAFEQKGLRAFMQYRDLGLRRATSGLMRAEHIRVVGKSDMKTGWHCHDPDFQFVFVLKGHVRFITEGGETVTLRAGDCAHLPAFYRHDEIEFAPDFEVVEITAPADVKTIPGRDTPLPERLAAPGRISTFAASYDGPDAYRVGDGPRRFLAYRDVGATAATGRRVNVNVVRNSKAGNSSTGWHYHTLACQFIYVLKGWSRVEVEGQGEFTVRAGEAMTLPYNLKHDVTGFSADFTVLELNIPADYETIACDPPGRKAA